jgi:hypothetical protein
MQINSKPTQKHSPFDFQRRKAEAQKSEHISHGPTKEEKGPRGNGGP